MLDAMTLYNISRRLHEKKMNYLAKFIMLYNNRRHNSYIPYTAVIGQGSTFAYGGIGVVLHSNCIIGKNCMIGQGITIGGRGQHGGPPIIGDNVYIGPGVRLIGNFNVGDNSIIGANSVVIKEVPKNAVIAGVPARVIKYRE